MKFSIFLTLFFVSLYFLHPIPLQGANVDLGHHLLLGKLISESGVVNTTNFLSFSYPNFPYINTHWLTDVIFFQVQNSLGYAGLLITTTGISLFAFFLLLKIASKKVGFVFPCVVALFYLQIMSDRTEVKPELLSLLLLSLTLFILYKFKEKMSKIIFFLVPIQLLWVNLHLYFIVGLITILLFAIGAFISERKNGKFVKAKRLLIVFAISSVVSIINPNLLNGALFPLTFFNNYGYKVIENLDFVNAARLHGNYTFLYFTVAVIFLWVGIFTFLKKISPFDILLSIFFTAIPLIAVRGFSLFVIGTFIPISVVLCLSYRKFKNLLPVKLTGNFDLLAIIIYTIVLFPGVFISFSNHGFGIGVKDNANDAVDFLKKNRILGPVYNNYNIGNYLEYQIYPQKVFVDGRPEGYPKEFFEKEYYPSEVSFESFEKIYNKYKFNYIFYEHKNQTENGNPLLSGLSKSKTWKMVFLNSSIVIFVNSKLAESGFMLKITENSTAIPTVKDPSEFRELSNFYRAIGWIKQMYEVDIMYLEHDPNNCVALRHVAVIMRDTNHPLANQYLSKFNLKCSQ